MKIPTCFKWNLKKQYLTIDMSLYPEKFRLSASGIYSIPKHLSSPGRRLHHSFSSDWDFFSFILSLSRRVDARRSLKAY